MINNSNSIRVEKTITNYATKIVYRHPTKPLTVVSDGTFENTRILINQPEDTCHLDHAYSMAELLTIYADQIIEDYQKRHYPIFFIDLDGRNEHE